MVKLQWINGVKNVNNIYLLYGLIVDFLRVFHNYKNKVVNCWVKKILIQLDLINYYSILYTKVNKFLHLLNKTFTHNPQPLLLR